MSDKTVAAPVPRQRLVDLALLMQDESFVLGPLDQRDLESLLLELLEWRTGERVFDREAS